MFIKVVGAVVRRFTRKEFAARFPEYRDRTAKRRQSARDESFVALLLVS
jgi:hypothetical protein